jgi:GntR family transcriptional regulator of vanillate catabolism
MVGRCNVIPFVSPATIAFDRDDLAAVYDFLSYAHRQHHAIVEAIRTRNASRAEFLLREHATTQEASMNFADYETRVRRAR